MPPELDGQALAEAGLDGSRVAALLECAEGGVTGGELPSCQLALAREGEVLVDAAFGACDARSRYVAFSVTKALTAGAVWLLLGDGRLDPGTRVAEVIEEFGEQDKGSVTVEHLLTHTAGFPRAPMAPEEGADPRRRVARFAEWRLEWEPGTRTEYHGTSAYWVLVELIERLTGTDFRRFFADAVARPLGIPGVQLGAPVGEQEGICEVVLVGDPPDEASGGLAITDVLEHAGPSYVLSYNEPEVRAAGVPGVGGVSTAADLARYYQALLHNPGGLWDTEVLADATGTPRNTMVDPMLTVPANRSLGLVIAGADGNGWIRQFGEKAGPRAFGASGIGGQIAWADPDTGLSFAYLTNGIDADAVRFFLRANKLSTLAAECVVPSV